VIVVRPVLGIQAAPSDTTRAVTVVPELHAIVTVLLNAPTSNGPMIFDVPFVTVTAWSATGNAVPPAVVYWLVVVNVTVIGDPAPFAISIVSRPVFGKELPLVASTAPSAGNVAPPGVDVVTVIDVAAI
jgi:hypothetical protein